jgi:predicted double-glycine peptidase
MRYDSRAKLLIGVLPLLLACAARPNEPTAATHTLPVPLVRQATDYSCGAAVLLSVLYYWRVFDGREDELYVALHTTTSEGTAPEKIAEVARSFGLTADLREGTTVADLRAALARGDTVIVDLQAWHEGTGPGFRWRDTWDDGHYAVLVGIDAKRAYFMDPSVPGSYAYLPVAELHERWHDYENRSGKMIRYQQLAIFIRGRDPVQSIPGPPVPME